LSSTSHTFLGLQFGAAAFLKKHISFSKNLVLLLGKKSTFFPFRSSQVWK